ncbi:nucleotide-diphospho-sugar transferase [Mucilaginibacter sp. ZT4R22]|uniref:Nucleotide-diphospho-sugar transferase n=1 Tax=Mucilaginibacter pankratovii TaxID=2772110 RepID=A0ABR7WR29_9SPHI|nr:nucleotide-diphospho-sugar transferase [Mucilaginibacter pankratovii]MBD1364783.1 nucleotide-diphospho-sugar transferase [Mucilaginibacter pankratovii]
MSEIHPPYYTQSPVLFIVFNRPGLTARVFEKIKEAQPAKLYIAADGARNSREGEDELCRQTREVVSKIDWPCEVKTCYRENNLGCKEAVSSAVTWFFQQEEEGIVLEDDCLPVNGFFKFCDELLELYRHDTRIRHITGCNLQRGKKWGAASYYFSNITHVWGWAGWRRVWDGYDKELSQYSESEAEHQLANIFSHPMVVEDWTNTFKRVKAGEIDTWDYQYGFLNYFNNSLCIIPNQNLISNIGFGANSTHTSDANNPNANIPTEEIGSLTHPQYFLPEKQADFFTMDQDLSIAKRVRRNKRPNRRIKRWFKTLFK